MFGFRKKKKELAVFACCKGVVKDLANVNDPVFAEGLAGKGLAITPTDNKFYAPVSGTVVTAMPSKHAFGIQADNGFEFLIHIGIDTVNLKGEGFTSSINQGDKVNAGDLLCEVDLDYVKAQGKEIDTMLLLCSPEGELQELAKEGLTTDLTTTVFKVKK